MSRRVWRAWTDTVGGVRLFGKLGSVQNEEVCGMWSESVCSEAACGVRRCVDVITYLTVPS